MPASIPRPFTFSPATRVAAGDSVDSLPATKSLELPFLVTNATPSPSTPHFLKVRLLASYSALLFFAIAYLALSGYASFWATSAYIGAVVGVNTLFFSIVLLCTTWSSPSHPLARPSSATLGPTVCAALLAAGWGIAASILIRSAVSIGSSEAKRVVGSERRLWVFAELVLSTCCFASTVLVVVLQGIQVSRYDAFIRRPRSVLAFITAMYRIADGERSASAISHV